MTMKKRMILRLIWMAYERGWHDACDDYLAQHRDSDHAIGVSKRADVNDVLTFIDPQNVLDLRE